MRLHKLEDIAAITGGAVHSKHSGFTLETMTADQLSRAAQVRVTAERPAILADEPAGSPDTAAGRAVLALLASLHAGATIVVTHNSEIADAVPRAAGCATARSSTTARERRTRSGWRSEPGKPSEVCTPEQLSSEPGEHRETHF